MSLFYAISPPRRISQWQSLRQQGSFANLYFLKANRIKMQRKDIAACHRTKAAKRLRHKNTKPTAQKPSFLFRFLLALAHAAKAGR